MLSKEDLQCSKNLFCAPYARIVDVPDKVWEKSTLQNKR